MASDLETWARSAPLTELRQAAAEVRERVGVHSSPADEAELRTLDPILADRELEGYRDWLTTADRAELERARGEATDELAHSSSPAAQRVLYDVDLRLQAVKDVEVVRGRQPDEAYAKEWLEHRLTTASREELRALESELHSSARTTFDRELATGFTHRLEWAEERFDRLAPDEARGLSREALDARAGALSDRLAAGDYPGRAEDAAMHGVVVREQSRRDRAETEAWASGMTVEQLSAELRTLHDKAEFGQATPLEQTRLAHGTAVLADQRAEALTTWLQSLSMDDLKVTIADLERRVERDGAAGPEPSVTQGTLFWARTELWAREHGDKGLDTLVIDGNGRVGTIRDLATESYRAYVQGGLDVLRGNIVAALTFHLSDDPHLAALAGNVFDIVGEVAQARAGFRQTWGPASGDAPVPAPVRAPSGSDDAPPAAAPTSPSATADWAALRERVDVPVPRTSDRGYRVQVEREGDVGIVRIEGRVGDPVSPAESAARHGTRLPGEHATHGVGANQGENVGPSGMGSAPATFNLSDMKKFENQLRQVADAAEPFGGVVETVTYLRVEYRQVRGEEVQVIVGVERTADLRLPGSDTLHPVARLSAEIDPVTRVVRPTEGGGAATEPGSGVDAATASGGDSPWAAVLRELVEPLTVRPEPTIPRTPAVAVPAHVGPRPPAPDTRAEAEGPEPTSQPTAAQDPATPPGADGTFDMEAEAGRVERELEAERDPGPSPLVEPEPAHPGAGGSGGAAGTPAGDPPATGSGPWWGRGADTAGTDGGAATASAASAAGALVETEPGPTPAAHERVEAAWPPGSSSTEAAPPAGTAPVPGADDGGTAGSRGDDATALTVESPDEDEVREPGGAESLAGEPPEGRDELLTAEAPEPPPPEPPPEPPSDEVQPQQLSTGSGGVA